MTIYAKLMTAVMNAKNPAKNAINPHFRNKYATLDVICDDIREACKSAGVAVMQIPTLDDDGRFVLRATAIAENENLALGDYPIRPTKDDPQGVGSAITYARRYQICALFGIAAEEDDDGNAGSAKQAETAKQAPKAQPAQQKTQETAKASETDTMRAELMHVLSGVSDTREGKIAYMEKHWGISSVKDADEKTVADLHRRICK